MIGQLDAARRAFIHGVRWLTRRPLASLTSALCLAVGIGACAVAWTLLDATIFRPFGLRDAERLVVVWEANPARGHELIEVSLPNFLDWQREAKTMEAMAVFGSSHWPALARIGSETLPLAARGVSAMFFGTLGVRPALGRDFSEVDLGPGATMPVLLSHRLWQTRFAGNPDIVGQSLFVDGSERQIIGVMPQGFAYPDDPDVWVSVERTLENAFSSMPPDQQRQVGILEVLGRRRAEVSNDDVRAELTAIVGNLRKRYAPSDVGAVAVVTPYSDVLLGRIGSRLWIALGMAAGVMLFACANVAAVRMAQLRERRTELAARLYLGASRSRLRSDLALEAVPLITVAALLAAVIWFGIVAMLSESSVVSESGVTLLEHRRTAMLAIGLLAATSWLLVAMLPAMTASRPTLADAQLSSFRIARRSSAIGAPLLFGQAAMAIVVVAIAGAALQTFDRLSRTDMGFATDGVTLVDVGVPGWKYPTGADGRRLMERLQHALRELPGVTHVAAVSVRPFRFGDIVDGQPVRREGNTLINPGDAAPGSRVIVTPDYFAALGQPIVEGRGFTDFDKADTQPVVVISRTLARALFGNEPAIGQRIETYSLREKWRPRLVIGIAGDARYRGLERPSMEIYVPHAQLANALESYVIGSKASAPVTDAMLRQALGAVEPELAIERVLTTGELVQTVLSPARLLATLVTFLGGAGLLLLALGLFGAAAAALRAAWSEIAVRQAIGARPFQAARAPLGMLGRALLAGIVVGLLLTPLALSAVQALGLATDGQIALPLLAAAAAVIVAATVATAPSIWRASRTSPAELLRQ